MGMAVSSLAHAPRKQNGYELLAAAEATEPWPHAEQPYLWTTRAPASEFPQTAPWREAPLGLASLAVVPTLPPERADLQELAAEGASPARAPLAEGAAHASASLLVHPKATRCRT